MTMDDLAFAYDLERHEAVRQSTAPTYLLQR
jgi:hypothetical protein